MCQFSDHFYSAVRTLSGEGSIKERLASAYGDNLDQIVDDDVPQIIRPRFELLKRQLHMATPNGRESAVIASVRKMSAGEAAGCASLIVAMFSELVRVKATGERLTLMNRERELRVDASPKGTNGNGRDPATLN